MDRPMRVTPEQLCQIESALLGEPAGVGRDPGPAGSGQGNGPWPSAGDDDPGGPLDVLPGHHATRTGALQLLDVEAGLCGDLPGQW